MKLVKFGDSKVTPKAKEMLEKAYAQKTLGVPCVIELENDDSEYDTLNTLRQHADEMGGCVIHLLLGSIGIERVTERNLGSGHFLVYVP
jgi:hypothetical protein